MKHLEISYTDLIKECLKGSGLEWHTSGKLSRGEQVLLELQGADPINLDDYNGYLMVKTLIKTQVKLYEQKGIKSSVINWFPIDTLPVQDKLYLTENSFGHKNMYRFNPKLGMFIHNTGGTGIEPVRNLILWAEI